MTDLEINAFRLLACKWNQMSRGGFMPDPEGNKIAVTRTMRCAEELDELVEVLVDLQRITGQG